MDNREIELLVALDIETVGDGNQQLYDEMFKHEPGSKLYDKLHKESLRDRSGLHFWENKIAPVGVYEHSSLNDLHNECVDTFSYAFFEPKTEESLKLWRGLICHNGKFELVNFKHHDNYELDIKFDTFIAEKITTAGLYEFNNCDLEDTTLRRLGIQRDKRKELRVAPWFDHITPEMVRYLKEDCMYLHYIALKQWEEIKECKLEHIFDLEMKTLYATADMELNGIYIDEKRLDEYIYLYNEEKARWAHTIHQFLGAWLDDKGLNSPSQLKKAFKNYGLSLPGTEEGVLERFKEDVAVNALLNYRKAHKVLSTYLLPYKHERVNGRVHCSWNQLGTETGRYSSSGRNLQNVPAEIRDIFIPEPGSVFINADLSQIEPRILAELSGDERLIDIFMRGMDAYTGAAQLFYGVEEVSKKQRNDIKAVKLGLMYDKGAKALAATLGISEVEGELLYEKYHNMFPKVAEFRRRKHFDAKQNLFVRTVGGRIRYLWDLNHSNKWVRQKAEREIVNTIIQGTAADGNKQALCLMRERLPKEAKIVATIHDEVLVECSENIKEEVLNIVRECMIKGNEIYLKNVPVKCEPKTIKNWKEGKD